MNLFLIVASWRVLLFVLARGVQVLPFTPSFPYGDVYLIPSGLPRWIWAWANFDGVHYLTIAKHGYMAQFTQVFFPLYPLVISLGGLINNDRSLILNGLLISFLAFYFGVKIFTKLLSLDYKANTIKQTVALLLIFPTSFFFAALYTEALFFFLVIASFWFARRKQWWLSAIFGTFASATRITGIFLLPALLWEWHHNIKYQKSKIKRVKKITKVTKKLLQIFIETLRSPILYLVPLGLVSYMVYLQLAFGDALYFWHAQPVFGAQRSGGQLIFPLQVIWRYLKILSSISYQRYEFWSAFWELAAFILTIILLLKAHQKKIRLSYLIFGWLTTLVPTFTGTFSSLPRYILMTFPIFIVMGLIKNKTVYYTLCLVFLGLLILFTSNFLQGLWVA